jgi:hypothetical protein
LVSSQVKATTAAAEGKRRVGHVPTCLSWGMDLMLVKEWTRLPSS